MTFVVAPEGNASDFIQALHHTFGVNDLMVARRQMRMATGAVHERWAEIVEMLEHRRGWRSRS